MAEPPAVLPAVVPPVFRVHQLATDITENVTRHLNPLDLIELAFVTKDWLNLVKSLRVHVKTLYLGLRGTVPYMTRLPDNGGLASIVLGVQLDERGFSHFFFYEKTQEQIDTELAEDPKFVIRKYDGVRLKCKIDSSTVKVYTADPLNAFYAVLKHCFCLFPGTPTHLSLGYVHEDIDNILLTVLGLHNIGACEHVAIASGCSISEPLLRHLLGMNSLKRLHNSASCDTEFRYYYPIRIRNLNLPFAEWVNRRTLMMLDCERVELGDPEVTLKDMNAFIVRWTKQTSKRLKILSMIFCKGWGAWEHDEKGGRDLFVDLDPITWIPGKSSRGRYFEENSRRLDCEKGKDIVRRDGALATIVCDKSSFHFVIWKYPE